MDWTNFIPPVVSANGITVAKEVIVPQVREWKSRGDMTKTALAAIMGGDAYRLMADKVVNTLRDTGVVSHAGGGVWTWLWSEPTEQQPEDVSSAPASVGIMVTPDDVARLSRGPCRAFFVGVGGTVFCEDIEGNLVEIVSVGSQYHPMRVRKFLKTGTTAGKIVALY